MQLTHADYQEAQLLDKNSFTATPKMNETN